MACLSSGLCPNYSFLNKHNKANLMKVTASSQVLTGPQVVHVHRCTSALAALVPVTRSYTATVDLVEMFLNKRAPSSLDPPGSKQKKLDPAVQERVLPLHWSKELRD